VLLFQGQDLESYSEEQLTGIIDPFRAAQNSGDAPALIMDSNMEGLREKFGKLSQTAEKISQTVVEDSPAREEETPARGKGSPARGHFPLAKKGCPAIRRNGVQQFFRCKSGGGEG
jgi:hypothetical protein